MTMHEEFTDKLSDYLDGELTGDERTAVEAHLRGCESCARVCDELRRVIGRAAALTPRPPSRDLWDGIAGRIDARRTAAVTAFPSQAQRRVSFTLPQLAAAAVLLIAVSGGVAWQIGERAARGPREAAGNGEREASAERSQSDASVERSQPDASADRSVTHVGLADAQYDAAVADLEKAVKQGRGRLDATTISVVEHNLQIIDQAIAQARDALAADPANTYLSGHLVEARRRKLDLLRRAAALAESN